MCDFKVGDTVRFTKEALCADSDLPEGLMKVTLTDVDGYVHYVDPADADSGFKGFCRPSWLEPAPRDLKAERAMHLAAIAEIDKSLNEAAASDGLSRLQAIVGETGYFRDRNCFYRYNHVEGIKETDIIGHYDVMVSEGYGFSAARGEVEASTEKFCCVFPNDLEGWSVISGARFAKAKSDYEAVVSMVKEAMEP